MLCNMDAADAAVDVDGLLYGLVGVCGSLEVRLHRCLGVRRQPTRGAHVKFPLQCPVLQRNYECFHMTDINTYLDHCWTKERTLLLSTNLRQFVVCFDLDRSNVYAIKVGVPFSTIALETYVKNKVRGVTSPSHVCSI